MKTCVRLRAAILRSTESEASPAESLRVARHLDACTACRIVAARARRLAAALNALDDAVPLDDEAFLRDVMAALESTPPPIARGELARRRRAWILRKRVHIAGIAALALLAGATMARSIPLSLESGRALLPGLAESPDSFSDAMSVLAALAGVALEGLGWGGRIAPPLPDLRAAAQAGLAMAGFAAAAAGACAVAAAWRARVPIR